MKQVLNVGKLSLILLTCSLLLLPTSLWAATYYVDINKGTDDGSHGGSSGTGAWQTLHYAVTRISNGDTVNVAAGTYSQGNGEDGSSELNINRSNVTIEGAGTGLTIVDGSGASGWAFGITITGSHVTVKDLTVRDFHGGDPSTGFRIASGTGNVIEGCKIRDGEHGIRIESSSSSNIVRNDCHVFNNSSSGIFVNGSNGNEIYGNEVHDNGTGLTGIRIENGAANNLIHHNDIYDTGGADQLTGISFVGAGSGNEVYENDIHDHYFYGMHIEDCSPEVRKNRIYDNRLRGIDIAPTGGTASPKIWNNLIYDSTGSSMQTGIYISVITGIAVASPTIYHNTIDGGIVDGIYVFEDVGTAAPDIRYNIITNFGNAGIENDGSYPGSPTVDYNNVWNNSVADYLNVTAGPHDISQKPRYASYELRSTSPCIDAIPSSVSDPVGDDIDGNPRPQGDSHDMGAYEFPVSVAEVIPVPPGTEVPEYIMVSFTVLPDNPACNNVFKDDMGGSYDPDNFKIGGYDPTLKGGSYRECNSGLVIEPGSAYWMLARNGFKATVDGVPASLNDTEVELLYNTSNGNGWKQIGCPNDADYRWKDVEVVEYSGGGAIISGPTAISALPDNNLLIDKRLWRWVNGSYYSDTTKMVRGKGYWVRARKANVSLVFHQSAQLAQLSNASIMFADLWSKAKRWAKQWVFGPQAAIAYSDDTPPMPMEGLSFGAEEDMPGQTEGGGGGCLIDTTAQGVLAR